MSALPSSRPDDLRQVALRVFSEIITGGDLALADVLIAPDYVDHRGGPPGRDGFKLGLQMIRAAFPDWSSTPEDMVVEGDKVAARWTVRGTHQGDFMGIPATGRQITMGEAGILRFEDGCLVELWRVADELGMLRQLGVLPTPTAAGGA